MKEIDTRYNPANEIVKYKYFERLEHCRDGKDPKTVTQHINAVHELEVATGFQDFKKYNYDWAIIYKNHLNDKRNARTGEHISKSLFFNYLSHVRRFIQSLRENEKGYAKIKLTDIDYLYPSRKEKNQAKASDHPESHDIADIITAIRLMPERTEIEMRDKALMSLLLVTVPRMSSIKAARLKSIRYFKDYDAWAFIQDPRLQNTKFSKNITAFFIGNVQDINDNILKWKAHLEAKGFSDKDHLFPQIRAPFAKGGGNLLVVTRSPIQSDTKIRSIVRKAFKNNDLKYIKPHNFRHSMIRHVKNTAPDPVNTGIALGENVGHKNGFSGNQRAYGGDPEAVIAKLMKAILLE